MKDLISVVIPLFNEQESILALAQELIKLKGNLKYDLELIFVDDGSTDGSFEKLLKFKNDGNDISIVKLKKNFGQTAAIAAGFAQAEGDIVVTMDADLQNDPHDIPLLIAEIEKGNDVASGWRRMRKDSFFSRKLPSAIANKIISCYTGVHLHDYGCTLKAYRREILKDLNLYGELHRFIPALLSWKGAKIAEIPVRHSKRKFGKSKYGISRTISVILDLLTVKFLLSSAKGPMQIFGRFGLWCLALGFISGLAAIHMKIFGAIDLTGNPLLYLAVLFSIVSLQFVSIGLLGEINIRIFNRSQETNVYVIEKVIS